MVEAIYILATVIFAFLDSFLCGLGQFCAPSHFLVWGQKYLFESFVKDWKIKAIIVITGIKTTKKSIRKTNQLKSTAQ